MPKKRLDWPDNFAHVDDVRAEIGEMVERLCELHDLQTHAKVKFQRKINTTTRNGQLRFGGIFMRASCYGSKVISSDTKWRA